jgi:hypothetical protein
MEKLVTPLIFCTNIVVDIPQNKKYSLINVLVHDRVKFLTLGPKQA